MLEGTLLWLVAAVVIALWIPQNAAHEGAHVVAHRHWGAKITKFIVYPTNAEDQFSLAFWRKGFTWACMGYNQPKDRPLDATARGVCSIAPQFTNTVVCSVLLALSWRFPDLPPALASVLVAWYLVNFVDGAYCLGTFYKWGVEFDDQGLAKDGSDGWKLQRYWNLPANLCRSGAVAWHVWFGFHLLIPPSWV